jgi:hypothetical protein
MEAITQLYITLIGFVFFCLLLTLYVIAGKDIIFSFRRRFQPNGADIFILNANRHVDRYYKKPNKDGNFTIGDKTYITNPEKVGSLSDKMKESARLSEERRKKKLHKRIQKLTKKKDIWAKKLASLQETSNPPTHTISSMQEQIATLDDKIIFLKSKLPFKEQSYYMARRSVYFYVENDPIPKDMFEYLSEFDVIQIDNLVSRALSKSPQAAQDMEKTLKQLRLYLLIAMGIAALAAWFAVKGSMGIEDIAKNLGVTLTI